MLTWLSAVSYTHLRRVPAGAGAAGALALPGDTGKGGADMTLLELSAVYAENAAVLHGRITELRRMVRLEPDRETARALQRRVEALLPLWREARSRCV